MSSTAQVIRANIARGARLAFVARAATRLAPYLAFLAAVLGEGVVLYPPLFNLTDHLVFWQVGHVIVTGGSPYDLEAWREAGARFGGHIADLLDHPRPVPWPHPPWTALVFAPFGLLSPLLGTWALHLSYLVAGLAGTVLLARQLPWSTRSGYTYALVLLITFQPLVIAARWGQFGSFLLVGAALVSVGVGRRATAPFAVGTLLLFLKPHLSVGLAPVALARLVTRRDWRTIAVTSLALVAVAVVTFVAQPAASETIGIGVVDRLKVAYLFGSTWSFALNTAGAFAVPVEVALVAASTAACAAAVFWAPPRLRDHALLAAGFVFSEAAVPYLFSYDYVLLAPAVAFSVLAAERAPAAVRAAHLLTALVVVTFVPWIAFFYAIMQATQAASGVVPVFVALLLAASARLAAAADARAASP